MFIWGLWTHECNTVIQGGGLGPAEPAPPPEGRPAVSVCPSPNPGWHSSSVWSHLVAGRSKQCAHKSSGEAARELRQVSLRHAPEPLPWSGCHLHPSVRENLAMRIPGSSGPSTK